MSYYQGFTRYSDLPEGPLFDADGYCVNWDGAFGAVWIAWESERALTEDMREHPSVYGEDNVNA